MRDGNKPSHQSNGSLVPKDGQRLYMQQRLLLFFLCVRLYIQLELELVGKQYD